MTYTPRVANTRAMRYALTRARDAAADAACAASTLTDLKAGGLCFAAAFVFLLALGVV
jgi:hypothetical protein